jgi:hypothetical protein
MEDYFMRIFNLNEKYSIVCDFENTRNGFKHVATLHKNGFSVYETKICYLNRTWECFEFESILKKVIENYFENNEKDNFLNIIKELR